MISRENIVVKQLPEHLHLNGVQELRRELEPVLRGDRPALVFDFSRVRQMDGAGVEMLIECLDTVMKRDGDIKLAAVPPELCVILELTRVDRLFEIFETAEAAVASFCHVPADEMFGTQTSSGQTGGGTKPNGHFKLVS